MTKILITGTTGFLGPYLVAAARELGVEFLTGGRSGQDVDLDLSEPDSIRRAVDSIQVTHVLNAGALSTVGGCEQDPSLAMRCNAESVAALAGIGAGIGAGLRLLQVSTDLVFDGRQAPYLPTAEPQPLNHYGRSKLAGEEAALGAGGLVVRVPLMFGKSIDGRRGATDMLRSALSAGGGAVLGLYTNEFRTPMHAEDAARGLMALALSDRTGLAHLAGPERVSRWGFACRFEQVHGLRRCWRPVECSDSARPRDLSMITDAPVSRCLDAALGES